MNRPEIAATLRFARRLYRHAPRKRWLLHAAMLPYQRRRERTVVSADGTELSVRVSGRGAPVILVHGGLGSKDNGLLFAEVALSERFELWSYDRRGRGGSGDSSMYSLEAEIDDLLAVAGTVASPAHVVAHSFGAICAMLAAERGLAVRSLVLYEPPFNQYLVEDGAIAPIADAVTTGDLDGALDAAYRAIGAPEHEVARLRALPSVWKQLREAVPTFPREMQAMRGMRWEADRWSLGEIPTLLIAGSETRNPVFPTLDELGEAFPAAERMVIPGQGHLAVGFAPWEFAEGVSRFLSRH